MEKRALRVTRRFDPSVRLYVLLECALSASCNTSGNKARKHFAAPRWRYFNAMKTVGALTRGRMRRGAGGRGRDGRVSFNVSIFSSESLALTKEISAMELKGLRAPKNVPRLLGFSSYLLYFASRCGKYNSFPSSIELRCSIK